MFTLAAVRTFTLARHSTFNLVNKVVVQQQDFSTTLRRDEVFFTKKHEYVDVEGNVGTVGVSDYAQEALGDIVYAQLPEPDDEVTQGEECGALESVKAASELYSPVSGKVTEKNENVENGPALINQSPMKEGWLFKVELADKAELESLMSEDKYKEYLKSQEEDH